MIILGFEIKRVKNLSPVPSSGSWFGVIRESFTGAWQSNVDVDPPKTLVAFSAVFACVTLISSDIGKLRPRLMRKNPSTRVSDEVFENSPFLKILRRPNHYQTWMKFIETWVTSKLLNGNTYVLKEFDQRGMVTAMYVLDPNRVQVLVAESGDVFYKLNRDDLSGVPENLPAIPASDIIHDTMVALFHPLVGVSPIYACGVSATMGNKIQANSTNLFANASRPSGILTAPGSISEETAGRLKTAWEANYKGENVGKLAVLGDGLKYESVAMKAEDAQLIEQLKWTVEDVARAFHMPLYKIGGTPPSYNNIEALAQGYYSDCLQAIIESLESSLDHGLGLPSGYEIELDLDNLLRMDSSTLYERNNKAIAGGWMSPNEARMIANLQPVPGGDSPMMQQQNWTLEQLADRDAPVDAASVSPPPPDAGDGNSPEGDDGEEEEIEALARRFATTLLEDGNVAA